MSKKAFTLIEILIVVILLGILAAVVVPQFTDAAGDTRKSAADTVTRMLESQVQVYRARNEAFPTIEQLVTPPNGEDPYIDEDPNGTIEGYGWTIDTTDGTVTMTEPGDAGG